MFNHVDQRYKDYMVSKEWRKFRKKILGKRNKCENCGDTGELQVHHLTYERFTEELETDVMVLCLNCHEETHRRKFAIDNAPKLKKHLSPASLEYKTIKIEMFRDESISWSAKGVLAALHCDVEVDFDSVPSVVMDELIKAGYVYVD
jgi:hypothetical protein